MRALLLLGVAGAALAGAGGARAEGLAYDWIGTGDGTGPASAWNEAGNWASVPDGVAGVPSNADSISIGQGAVTVGTSGLGAANADVSGGTLHLVAGEELAFTEMLTIRDAGVVRVDGLLDAGTLEMSGGAIEGAGSLIFRNATQTGGSISGATLEAATYNYFGGSFSGTANIGESFVLSDNYGEASDTVTVAAGTSINGVGTDDGPAHASQDGNTRMSGTVSGFASYEQRGGLMDGAVSVGEYLLMESGTVSGTVAFETLFTLQDDSVVTADAVLTGGEGSSVEQYGGTMNGSVSGIDAYRQAGGSIGGTVSTRLYEIAGGTGEGFDNVTIGEELMLSGGSLARDGLVVPVFIHTGGSFSGSIVVDTYSLIDTGGSFTGVIDASDAFRLRPAGGNVTVDAQLTGTGRLIKAGKAAITLAHQDNDFTGGVTVKAGLLDVIDSALPDSAEVIVERGGTLKLTTNTDTLFTGSMTGTEGDLVKAGNGAATLSGNIDLGNLWLDAGVLNIGTGTSSNEAVFESAVIAANSTLYIAEHATLTIRVPKHIVNNGTLINDGTVHDDLDNNGEFFNNKDYNADVATNTGTIDNNKPGYWTGKIESNVGRIRNAVDATWDGAVQGNTGNITNDGTWLNGTVSNGRVGVDPGLDFGRLIYNSTTGSWSGDIAANYSWIFNEGGTWTGDVLTNHREIWNDNGYGEIGTGYWIGDVVSNNASIFNGGGGDWTGDVLSNAGYIKNDLPAVWRGNIYGNSDRIENRGQWHGDVVANAGTIFNTSADGWTGNVLANTGTILSERLWTGNISSSGRLVAGGTISGDIVNSGVLVLRGDLTADSVSFGADAFFDLDLDAAGVGEVLSVTGTAELAGTVRIKAGSAMTSGDYLTPYTILTAGSLSGQFAAVTTDLAFLAPTLDHAGNTVMVTLQRNTQEFDAVGVTGNQRAAAAAVEALGEGNAIYDAILWLAQEEAQHAFDQLSGEAYASARAAATSNALLVGDIALDRVDQALDGLDSRGSVSGYAAHPPSGDASTGTGLWTQFYGAHGVVHAGAGTSATDGWTGGVALGLDGLLGEWRVGVMLDAGKSTSDVEMLNSSVASTDYGAGLYGGTQWGDTRLALAGSFTRHDNASTRSVVMPGFVDELSASYAATTLQAGGELSHAFDFGAMSFTPFAGAAYASHATDGFTETGGAAALTSEPGNFDMAVATLGVTLDYQLVVGDDMLLTASASLGWQHAFAASPEASLALPNGLPISVTGNAASGDAAAFAAGLNLDLSDSSALDLRYNGQIGSHSQTHALMGTWATKM